MKIEIALTDYQLKLIKSKIGYRPDKKEVKVWIEETIASEIVNMKKENGPL